MKIGFLKNFALAALAAVTLLACEKDKSVRPTVDIQSDESFNEDHTAQVTIVLSSAIKKDLMINLAVSALSAPGTTAVPGSHLQFPASVKIAAEATSVTFTATLDPAGLSADTYSAGIQVLGGNGYYVNKDGGITYIKFDGSSYSGGGGSEGDGGGGEEGGNKDLSLQTNWSVSLDGDPYYYDGDPYIDLTINAPGIQYFYMEANSDAELAQWYGGTLAGLVKNWEDDNLERLAAGYEISDVLFSLSDPDFYMEYTEAGPTKVYLVEFDAQGKATGRYSITDVVLPEIEEETAIYDRISIHGTGDIFYTFDIFDKGDLTQANLQDNLLLIGQAVTDSYNLLGELFDADLTDFMNDAEYNDYDYDELPLQEYDVLIAGLNEDGNLTGEYNISTVNVDGHALQVLTSAARKAQAQRRPRVITKADEEETVITISIVGPLTVKSGWTATYDGRFEDTGENDDEYEDDFILSFAQKKHPLTRKHPIHR